MTVMMVVQLKRSQRLKSLKLVDDSLIMIAHAAQHAHAQCLLARGRKLIWEISQSNFSSHDNASLRET